MSGQLYAKSALPTGPQNRNGRSGERKFLGPTGTRATTPVVQTAVSRYTVCATPAPQCVTWTSYILHLFIFGLLNDAFSVKDIE
jgi:hypothetical protein